MLKGTIATPDFYGRIESISATLPNYTILVHKYTGELFIIVGVNKIVSGFFAKCTMYSIRRKRGKFAHFIDEEQIKKFYWKAV